MKIRDIVLAGILSAATTAGKLALSFVPNVEIVTLFFIVFTTTLGIKRSLMVAMVFVTTEILIYGFSTWVIGYYLIWPMLVLIVSALSKRVSSEYGYARQELYLAFSTECFCHNRILFLWTRLRTGILDQRIDF